MSRYIDADKLYELIRTNDYRLSTINGSIDYGMFTIGIKQAIDEIPTADVAEVKRGEWTKDDSDGCFCSFCGWYTDYDYDYVTNNGLGNDDFIYCSHCGARMDGGDFDEMPNIKSKE